MTNQTEPRRPHSQYLQSMQWTVKIWSLEQTSNRKLQKLNSFRTNEVYRKTYYLDGVEFLKKCKGKKARTCHNALASVWLCGKRRENAVKTSFIWTIGFPPVPNGVRPNVNARHNIIKHHLGLEHDGLRPKIEEKKVVGLKLGCQGLAFRTHVILGCYLLTILGFKLFFHFLVNFSAPKRR